MVLHLLTFKMSSWSSGSFSNHVIGTFVASKTESLPVLQTPCYIEWIEVTDIFHFVILIFANIKESPRAHTYCRGISIVNFVIVVVFAHSYIHFTYSV